MSATIAPETDQKKTRRTRRIELKFPARVDGKDDPDTDWHEITRLKDVSAFGASFALGRAVKRGRLIQMSMPMPQQLRSYDYLESQYQTWAIVRRCVAANRSITEPTYLMSVAFIGKHPPHSYLDNPSQLFDLSLNHEDDQWRVAATSESPSEIGLPEQDRRHSRYAIPIDIVVESVGNDETNIKSEPTVTENISIGGASVFSSLDLEIGSFLKVKSDQYKVSIKAIVRGKRLGADGISRLHIEFIDQLFPLIGIDYA